MGYSIAIRTLTGRIYSIRIVIVRSRMLYFNDQEPGIIRFVPSFIKIIGFLLLYDIIT